MNTAGRVKLLLNKLDITQRKFAEDLGISAPRLNNYISGSREIPQDILIKMAKITNCELRWLLTGEGEMFSNIHPIRSDHLPGSIKMISIPVAAHIAAGPCIQVLEDDPLEVIQLPLSLLTMPPPYYAFRVQGDSMSPFIIEGDIVVMSRDWRGVHLNDKICAFRTLDGITLKRLLLQPKKKTAWLMPMNHDYHPIQYDRDTPDLELVGVLILSIRRH